MTGAVCHMLFDAVAYAVALGATVVAARFAPSEQWSYGLHRIEPFAAFLNGALLVPMVGFLLFESYRRYLSPVDIDTRMTILLAVGGLLVNVASVYVLQGGEMSLNERGAYYHLLGDTGASIAVVVSMVAIEFTGSRRRRPHQPGASASASGRRNRRTTTAPSGSLSSIQTSPP